MLKKLLLIAIFANLLFAGDVTPTMYKITMKKLELVKDSGTTITMWEGTELIDIADKGAGADVANLISNFSAPDGIYTDVRATVSSAFILKACKDTNADGDIIDAADQCTKSTTVSDGTNYYSVKAIAGNTAGGAQEATAHAHPTATTITATDIPFPLTVINSKVINGNTSFTIDFDITNALTFTNDENEDGTTGDYGFILAAPVVTIR
jgi:hypothetical protein